MQQAPRSMTLVAVVVAQMGLVQSCEQSDGRLESGHGDASHEAGAGREPAAVHGDASQDAVAAYSTSEEADSRRCKDGWCCFEVVTASDCALVEVCGWETFFRCEEDPGALCDAPSTVYCDGGATLPDWFFSRRCVISGIGTEHDALGTGRFKIRYACPSTSPVTRAAFSSGIFEKREGGCDFSAAREPELRDSKCDRSYLWEN